MTVRRSAVMTVPVRPSRAELAFTASIPTSSSSASVAGLSLMVSMATTRSRSEASASSRNSENPTGPGVRSAARSVTRRRGSSRPSANWVSASRATQTLNTDALTAGRSASTATSCPPSSDYTQSWPVHSARSNISRMSTVTTAGFQGRVPPDGQGRRQILIVPAPPFPSELLDRRVAQHQVLDAVLAPEIDLRLGVVARALQGQDRAQAVGVVGDLVARRQGGHPPVAGPGPPGAPPGQPLRGGRRRRGLVAAPLDEVRGNLVQEARLPVVLRPAPPGPGRGPGEVQPPLSPGDPHVSQSAFLLQLLGVVHRPLVREDVLLHPGEE